MIITYENGKQRITHPTGVISEYTKEDIEKRKADLLDQKKSIEEQIAEADADILLASKSLEK
jgi:hypothetical protein